MCAPSAPTPPDPKETAAAQTGTNVSTAIANSALGNVNQVTPDGSLTYQQTGTYKFTDPTSGATYDIPLTTATQTLSAAQQQIKGRTDQAKINLAQLAQDQSGRLQGLLSSPLDLSGIPAAGNAGALGLPSYQQVGSGPQLQTGIQSGGTIQYAPGNAGSIAKTFSSGQPVQSQIANAGNIQKSVSGYGDITKSYGPSDGYASNVQQVQDALLSRIQPQLDQQRSALEARLVNQGLAPGSEAYNRAVDQAGRQENDAYYGAILNAGQEQNRLASLDQAQAGFQNQAQQQAYNEAIGAGQFANSAQAQQFGQNQAQQQAQNAAQAQTFGQNQALAQFGNAAQQQLYSQLSGNAALNNAAQQQAYAQNANNAQFGNTALQQMYQNQVGATTANNATAAQSLNDQLTKINAQNAQRTQALQEAYAQRNQPINEIAALLSGSQVQNPQFTNTNQTSIPTVDYAGLVNQNYQDQLGIYNQQQAASQSLLGGLMGLGSAGIFKYSDRRLKKDIKKRGEIDGMGLYSFKYKGDPGKATHVGLMAQEVEKKRPEAVVTTPSGFKAVNYKAALPGLIGAS